VLIKIKSKNAVLLIKEFFFALLKEISNFAVKKFGNLWKTIFLLHKNGFIFN
jgi:hypothetical protein